MSEKVDAQVLELPSPERIEELKQEFEKICKRNYQKALGAIRKRFRNVKDEDRVDYVVGGFGRLWKKFIELNGMVNYPDSYFVRACINFGFDDQKKKRVKALELDSMVHSSDDGELAFDAPDPKPILIEDPYSRIQEALWSLPERERVFLEYMGSMDVTPTYEEIGQHFNIPIGTVKSRVFRARQKFLEVLKAFPEDLEYVQKVAGIYLEGSEEKMGNRNGFIQQEGCPFERMEDIGQYVVRALKEEKGRDYNLRGVLAHTVYPLFRDGDVTSKKGELRYKRLRRAIELRLKELGRGDEVEQWYTRLDKHLKRSIGEGVVGGDIELSDIFSEAGCPYVDVKAMAGAMKFIAAGNPSYQHLTLLSLEELLESAINHHTAGSDLVALAMDAILQSKGEFSKEVVLYWQDRFSRYMTGGAKMADVIPVATPPVVVKDAIRPEPPKPVFIDDETPPEAEAPLQVEPTIPEVASCSITPHWDAVVSQALASYAPGVVSELQKLKSQFSYATPAMAAALVEAYFELEIERRVQTRIAQDLSS